MAQDGIQGEESQQAEAPVESPMAKDRAKNKLTPARKKHVLVALVAVVVLGFLVYLISTWNDVETDDAYTTGRKIAIAAHVSGYVEKLLVDDNQFVHKGDVLVEIDGRDYLAALHRAQAAVHQAQADMESYRLSAIVAEKNFPGQLMAAEGNLAAAQAKLFQARTDYARQYRVERAATSQQDIDRAKAALDQATASVQQAQGQLTQAQPVKANIENAEARVSQAEASLESAQAELESARLNVTWMSVRAPRDGWVSQRSVEQGNFVQIGQEMFSIVAPEVWVVANYKETQLTHMHPGQKVDITVDAYPQLHLKGHVDSLQMGSGESFSTFPPENATGNFVKTVQRIPVKILIDEGLKSDLPLALGMSVIPIVHVK